MPPRPSIVMEYLEGKTLADRLKKGALLMDQVLWYGTEIADAPDRPTVPAIPGGGRLWGQFCWRGGRGGGKP
jgi:hypothetical protein